MNNLEEKHLVIRDLNENDLEVKVTAKIQIAENIIRYDTFIFTPPKNEQVCNILNIIGLFFNKMNCQHIKILEFVTEDEIPEGADRATLNAMDLVLESDARLNPPEDTEPVIEVSDMYDYDEASKVISFRIILITNDNPRIMEVEIPTEILKEHSGLQEVFEKDDGIEQCAAFFIHSFSEGLKSNGCKTYRIMHKNEKAPEGVFTKTHRLTEESIQKS